MILNKPHWKPLVKEKYQDTLSPNLNVCIGQGLDASGLCFLQTDPVFGHGSVHDKEISQNQIMLQIVRTNDFLKKPCGKTFCKAFII